MNTFLPTLLITGLTAVLSLFSAGAFALTPGDILVVGPRRLVDRVAETEGGGALLRVDPVTGAGEKLSDFGDGADPGFVPLDPAVEADGRVLVIASTLPERPDRRVLVIASAGREPGILLRRLFRVDPTSGARTVLSEFGSGADPENVRIAVEADGHILVLDPAAGTKERGALFRVDPVSGARTVLSDFGSDRNPGESPRDLAVEEDGHILVLDRFAGSKRRGALFRVNPITGSRDLLSDFGDGADGLPSRVAVEADGDILVSTEALPTIAEDPGQGDRGALLRVDPITGARTVLSDFGSGPNPGSGVVNGVEVEADGHILVLDVAAGTKGTGALFRVDPVSGARTVLPDFRGASEGIFPTGVAVVPDTTPPETRIDNRPPDPDTQTTATFHFSGTDDASPPAALGFECELDGGGFSACTNPKTYTGLSLGAHGFQVRARDAAGHVDLTPARHAWTVANALMCNGRSATIVGDNEANTIFGTAGNDVIHGRGGNDIIFGMQGNDVICGGAGDDQLSGNQGKDRLFGELGNDVLKGGEGNDRLFGQKGNDSMDGQGGNDDNCNGGPGADTATSCEQPLGVP